MKSKLLFRPLNEEDYEIACGWWDFWFKRSLPKGFLPDDGKSGFMIEKDNQPIACGFLYVTNSKVAFLGWVVSNPEYRQKDRKKIIKKLISNIEEVCVNMGYFYMFTVCSNKHLISMHEDLDWELCKKPSYEIIKNL